MTKQFIAKKGLTVKELVTVGSALLCGPLHHLVRDRYALGYGKGYFYRHARL